MRNAFLSFSILVVLGLAGCDTTERDWDEARRVDTVFSYRGFLAKHPAGKYSDSARRSLVIGETVNDAFSQADKVPAPRSGQQGSVDYGRSRLRNGAIVMKDVDDFYEGEGWIAGTVFKVITADTITLIVSVPASKAFTPKGKTKAYAVSVDGGTSVCLNKIVVPDGPTALSSIKPGQRVSVVFRSGTQTADRIVDQSYELVSRLSTPDSGSIGQGPSMPQCD